MSSIRDKLDKIRERVDSKAYGRVYGAKESCLACLVCYS